jgi:lipopolysaccharide export system permease protein
MRIHDRYVISGFVTSWLGSFGVFTILISSYLLMAELRSFLKESADLGSVGRYLLFSFPQFGGLLIPFISVTAAVFFFHRLTIHNEITALLASGVSRRRIAFPVLVLGLFLTGLLWLWNEKVVPAATMRARDILDNEIEKKDLQAARGRGRWFRAPNNRFFRAEWYDDERQVLHQVMLLEVNRESSDLVGLTEAPEARWVDGYWVFDHPVYWEFDQGKPRRAQSPAVRKVEGSPDDLEALAIRPREMSFADLSEVIRQLADEGESVRRFLPELWAKTAFPWACLILLLYAVASGLQVRGEAVTLNLGVVMAVSLAYYGLFALLLAIGEKGRINPWVSAWGSNVIFAIGGLFYLHRVNR